MKSFLSLRDCLGVNKVDRLYYDGLSFPTPTTSNGSSVSTPGASSLPSMSSVYGNLNFPTNVNDIGGSAATEANTLNTGTNNAFGTYMDYAKSLQSPTDQYSALLKQNGIPQLQQTSENLQGNINNLENTMYRITPNVSANTTNSLVTDSQRQGMVAAQELPIQSQLQPLESNLSTVENSLGTQEQNVASEVNAENTYQGNMLNAAGMGVTVAQDNAARTMTGFTTDQQNTLQMLMAKLQAQETLDSSEWTTLSDLAGKQVDYQNALGQIGAGVSANNSMLQNRYITTPNGMVMNTATGQIENPGVLAAKGSFTPKA